MFDADLAYHLRRAEAEERQAQQAKDPATAHVHRELARLHRQRAGTAEHHGA